jgi:hypothetical protein
MIIFNEKVEKNYRGDVYVEQLAHIFATWFITKRLCSLPPPEENRRVAVLMHSLPP